MNADDTDPQSFILDIHRRVSAFIGG